MNYPVRTTGLTCALCLILAGCNLLEDNSARRLQGTWFIESPIETVDETSLTFRHEISFRDNGTYENVSVVLEASSGQLLGYRYAAQGRYGLRGNQLTLTWLSRASHDDTMGRYSLREKLIPIAVQENPLTLSIEIVGDVMTWKYPPCGPNENCIASQQFTRKPE